MKLGLLARRWCSIVWAVYAARVRPWLNDLAGNDLARAFALSLLAHFILIAGIELGHSLGLWRGSVMPQWVKKAVQDLGRKDLPLREITLPVQREEEDIPMIFVEIDPAQAQPEPPKNTKYYSTQNTVASNPDTVTPKDVPKIEGTQEKVAKVFDTLRPDPKALRPEPPPEPKTEAPKPAKTEPAPKPQPEEPEKEKSDPKPEGDILLARAAPRPSTLKPEPKPQRPRTLNEARQQKGLIQGEKMRQEGGARRHSLASNLDVQASPFGSYDAAFIAAVQTRWYSLIDERDVVRDETGKVVVEFRLNRDGRITEMRVAETDVSETLAWLCQRAVLDPAPYRPFPPDLRRLLNRDYREVRFTFYYN